MKAVDQATAKDLSQKSDDKSDEGIAHW